MVDFQSSGLLTNCNVYFFAINKAVSNSLCKGLKQISRSFQIVFCFLDELNILLLSAWPVDQPTALTVSCASSCRFPIHILIFYTAHHHSLTKRSTNQPEILRRQTENACINCRRFLKNCQDVVQSCRPPSIPDWDTLMLPLFDLLISDFGSVTI